ncbi:hypothetical protein LF1_11290 [Rubripirellula obstinata]|uniref:Uncharacterized protein n=1 Tax=Rubripirellula obstinata TaxID=406547 RepID=A0A5B1CBW2_9BACT|nr:hypothetical protein [Rubripirellula obstinata]KAA1258607.1 hypothetical protein LF1_11290 [Rubripirellula obstinata]
MSEQTETCHWELAVADARCIDPSDFWETAKLLCGITALTMIDEITEEQAEYARRIFSERSRHANHMDLQPSDERQRNELWTLVVAQAKSSVEENDGWERLKILIGLTQLFGFGMISQEQVDHVRSLLLGENDGAN